MSDDDLLTQAEAARLIGRNPNTVNCWVRKGRLKPAGRKRNGCGVLVKGFRRADVLALDAASPRSQYPRGDPTAEELDRLIAEQMKRLPRWWGSETRRVSDMDVTAVVRRALAAAKKCKRGKR